MIRVGGATRKGKDDRTNRLTVGPAASFVIERLIRLAVNGVVQHVPSPTNLP